MANMEMPPVEELVARFKKLYTGIVADAMDKLGMRDRLLSSPAEARYGHCRPGVHRLR